MSYLVRTAGVRASQSPLTCPESDDTYFYVVVRALSFYPTVNQNSAFFVESDIAPLIGTEDGFTFTIANVRHNIGPRTGVNQIIGVVREERVVPGQGIDVLVQFDRRACDVYGIGPKDFMPGGELSSASIEILCLRDQSQFVALTDPSSDSLDDQTVFSAGDATAQGIRRTDQSEVAPYYYQDRYVVAERCVPARVRGIAFLDDPADPTANVFEVAARMNKIEKPYGPEAHYADPGFDGVKARYPVDTASHVRAAASYWGVPANRDKYTPAQQAHVTSEINDAKRKFGIGEERAGFAECDIPDFAALYGDRDLSDLATHYDTPDVAPEEDAALPGEAYAQHAYDPYEVTEEKSHPLYATASDFASGRPHHALVKAALSAYGDKKLPNAPQAAHRILVAHKQLFPGDNTMDEQLKAEIATLQAKRDELAGQVTTSADALTAKGTEIANLRVELDAKNTELATANDKIAQQDRTERASQRLTALSAIEGFAVKDEEKAALVEALGSEDDTSFELRKVREENASLTRKLAAVPAVAPTDEIAGANRDEEIAAARADLGDLASFKGADGKPLTLDSFI